MQPRLGPMFFQSSPAKYVESNVWACSVAVLSNSETTETALARETEETAEKRRGI